MSDSSNSNAPAQKQDDTKATFMQFLKELSDGELAIVKVIVVGLRNSDTGALHEVKKVAPLGWCDAITQLVADIEAKQQLAGGAE